MSTTIEPQLSPPGAKMAQLESMSTNKTDALGSTKSTVSTFSIPSPPRMKVSHRYSNSFKGNFSANTPAEDELWNLSETVPLGPPLRWSDSPIPSFDVSFQDDREEELEPVNAVNSPPQKRPDSRSSPWKRDMIRHQESSGQESFSMNPSLQKEGHCSLDLNPAQIQTVRNAETIEGKINTLGEENVESFRCDREEEQDITRAANTPLRKRLDSRASPWRRETATNQEIPKQELSPTDLSLQQAQAEIDDEECNSTLNISGDNSGARSKWRRARILHKNAKTAAKQTEEADADVGPINTQAEGDAKTIVIGAVRREYPPNWNTMSERRKKHWRKISRLE